MTPIEYIEGKEHIKHDTVDMNKANSNVTVTNRALQNCENILKLILIGFQTISFSFFL